MIVTETVCNFRHISTTRSANLLPAHTVRSPRVSRARQAPRRVGDRARPGPSSPAYSRYTSGRPDASGHVAQPRRSAWSPFPPEGSPNSIFCTWQLYPLPTCPVINTCCYRVFESRPAGLDARPAWSCRGCSPHATGTHRGRPRTRALPLSSTSSYHRRRLTTHRAPRAGPAARRPPSP